MLGNKKCSPTQHSRLGTRMPWVERNQFKPVWSTAWYWQNLTKVRATHDYVHNCTQAMHNSSELLFATWLIVREFPVCTLNAFAQHSVSGTQEKISNVKTVIFTVLWSLSERSWGSLDVTLMSDQLMNFLVCELSLHIN